MSEEPQEPESGPASEGHGDSGTRLAFEEEGDELDSAGIKELNAEVDRLLQSISLQNSEVGINSDLPGCEPQAVPKTENPDPLAGPQPVSAWYQGQYPLHRTLQLCQQADKSRREKDKERQIRDKERQIRDKERQIRDKELLERWPRVDGNAELRLLYEGAIPRQELSITFTTRT